MDNPPPARAGRRRLLKFGLLGLAIGIVAAIGAFPWFLGSAGARRWMLARAERAIAPAKLEVGTFRFSWFGPTKMTRFILRDARGVAVVDSPTATWDRNLGQILFDRLHLGILHLDRAAMDVERWEDGSINLYKALEPVLGRDPRTDLTIAVHRGTFRFRAPGLPKPVAASRTEFLLHLPPVPSPLRWDVKLAGSTPGANDYLAVTGKLARPVAGRSAPPDLTLDVASERWPIEILAQGSPFDFRASTKANALREAGTWTLTGQGAVVDLVAAGVPAIADRLAREPIQANWNVTVPIAEKEFSIHSLAIHTSFGSLEASRRGADAGKTKLDGSIDLGRLVRTFPDLGKEREGVALERGTIRLVAAIDETARTADVDLHATGLGGRAGGEAFTIAEPAVLSARIIPPSENGDQPLRGKLKVPSSPWTDGPITCALDGVYRRGADRLDLTSFDLEAKPGKLRVTGHVAGLHQERQVGLTGRFAPDWDAVNATLREKVGPDARVAGEPVTLRVSGSAAGASLADIRRQLVADIRLPLQGAELYGLVLGPANIDARMSQGDIKVEPIDTTLNRGKVHVEPSIRREPDGGMTLVLGKESSITRAEVNEEVSQRVLAFLVPVMQQATRARGTLSVDVDRAEIPLESSSDRKTLVEGEVEFTDVEFLPGPLADELLMAFNRPQRPIVRLNEPVLLSIHDGRVFQRGLALPIAGVTELRLEGSVGFDRSLDLKATVPITTAMFGPRDAQEPANNLTRITVPIGGTLSTPKIDKDAFRLGLRQAGVDLLTGGGLQGVADLLGKIAQKRERDPNAPPPPPRMSREERRAQRLERKAERRAQRMP